MTLEDFLAKLKSQPEAIAFSQTMTVIEAYYQFTPTTFSNGNLENSADENQGSCKLFAFAIDQNLSKTETLACFGAQYFKDVAINPEGTGHQNIRNFIKTGFEGLAFKTFPLNRL